MSLLHVNESRKMRKSKASTLISAQRSRNKPVHDLRSKSCEGMYKCPADDRPLDYGKIYPDQDIQTDLMSSAVRCVHYKAGCRWVDKASTLQDHLQICRFDAVACPNECTARLSRNCLQDHMEFTCPKRKVTCESCGQEFTGEAMETHQGNCPYEIVWCENKCGARLQQRYLNNHMKNECHKRTQPCQYCLKKFVYETLQSHYYTCDRFPVGCPNRCDPMKIPRENLDIHLKEQCPSVPVPCTFKEAGCKYIGPRFSLDQHCEDTIKYHLNLMCKLTNSQELRIQELTNQLDTLTLVTDGTLIWRITNYKAKFTDAKSQPGVELKSDPFYTSHYGYKLAASMFLNGNGSGENSHISLYIRMLPGEYDNLLDWPFRLPISFKLVDQCFDPEKRIHLEESFVPNPAWKQFQKPSKDVESMGFGYPKFVSHENIKNGTYVKDDTLFIKIKVDNSKFVIP